MQTNKLTRCDVDVYDVIPIALHIQRLQTVDTFWPFKYENDIPCEKYPLVNTYI